MERPNCSLPLLPRFLLKFLTAQPSHFVIYDGVGRAWGVFHLWRSKKSQAGVIRKAFVKLATGALAECLAKHVHVQGAADIGAFEPVVREVLEVLEKYRARFQELYVVFEGASYPFNL